MGKSINIINNLNEDNKKILRLIQRNGPLTKAEIIDITGIKLTTLNRIMKPLEEKELVHELAIGESTGGRKPIIYDVNSKKFYIIGIDISRTYTKLVITNLKYDLLGQKKFYMDETCTPKKTLEIISEKINEFLIELKIKRELLIGIGVGAVGPLNKEKGIILNAKNFPSNDWSNIEIKSILENYTNIPVYIDNGSNAAVLAEYYLGEGKGFSNIAYFNCGIGIRAGVISQGKVIRTINNEEDAFAHMVVDINGEVCECGNKGCIEAYSSILAIKKKFKNSTNEYKTLEDLNYREICSLAENNIAYARDIIVNAAEKFGIGLANYINLFNPQIVVLSGPLIVYSDLFYKIATNIALEKHYLTQKSKVVFSKSLSLKDNDITLGAALIVTEELLNIRK